MNYWLFQLINQLADRYDWIDDIMEFCAQDIVFAMIAILGILWFTGKKQNQKAVFFAAVTACAAMLIGSLVISPAVQHPRPFATHQVHQLVAHAADYSFPSDHAMLAFSIAFSVLLVKRRIGMLLLVLAVVTGFSRVYVGVHYPADIAGAAVLSAVAAFAVHLLRDRLDPIPERLIRIYGKARRLAVRR
ncbi:undecaprenyl-diphosphatase [Cohnella ginsengisoli]|uniref:Undecaprenyl-diphosphatase n=1 Tax=Cohnella ginsengisoli TaxID=425004 RepID=A0A9X4KNS7_9BACL|nr:undecaprenyl-diphosphatase [Cohnella ginsengisoli]MDG0793442.1 undecaprenyl-diphosphatase [Cohnella ginsengisoli]